jgi:hypothetical protein
LIGDGLTFGLTTLKYQPNHAVEIRAGYEKEPCDEATKKRLVIPI